MADLRCFYCDETVSEHKELNPKGRETDGEGGVGERGLNRQLYQV